MADKYDDLLAIRNQSAQQAALRQIASQAQAEVDDYHRYIAEGDTEKAAWAQRGYQALAMEFNAMLAGMAQQQQAPQQQPQQPQQPQTQQQFTQAEQEWINRNANVVRDPKKWAECVAAANSLIMRGYDRNSSEYLNAIELAIGLTGADGKEGFEMSTPETALEAVNNSQIARKFGPVTPDDYRQGMARLVENKKLGLYEVDR
jgi:hypothetical protein